MRSDPTKNMQIDDTIEGYRPFYDHSWADEVGQLADGHENLFEFVFDLMLGLKGISRTAALPHLAVGCAQSFWDGYRLGDLENSLLLPVILHITERLNQKIVFKSVDLSEVRKVMLELADEAVLKVTGKSVEFPTQQFWDDMAKVVPDDSDETKAAKNEFRISLWSVVRVAYSGMFFAYEDFFVRCLEVYTGNTIKNVGTVIRDIENGTDHDLKALVADCWRHDDIVAAKEIRNSLSHSGGRDTLKVQSCTHTVLIVDGTLQLLPKDLTELFEVLKPRIKSIVTWAVQQPAFS